MCIFIATVASYSLLALLPADSTGDNSIQGIPDKGRCKVLEKRLEEDDPAFDDSVIRFYYNKTLCKCFDDLVKRDEENAYDRFHECVTTCQTGQGAPRCVKTQTSDCSSGDDCDIFYFYDVDSETCKPFNTTYANYVQNAHENIFLRERYCQNDCSGFTKDDVCGTKNN
uniref:Putative secreted protein n=1 Tax=Amblyomma triste TaxID=251400 RepID=A0A023GCH7_AMBTT